MRVDPNYVNNLTSAISNSAAREQTLTDELSSGLRVGTLSDDPVAASANVQLNSSLARLDSFVQSSSGVQSKLQVTDSALGEVVSQVNSALSLAVSATNSTLSAENLSSIAKQLSDLRDSVVSLGNTSYQGTYVFAGSQGGTKPFTVDSTTTPATTTYNGDAVTQKIETPDGQSVQTNVAGSAIFTASGADLLDTLNKLVADVASGSTTDIAADTSALTSALATVSTQRSTIGSSLTRLTVTSGYAQTQQAQLEARQSDLLSASPATVASDLKTSEVQHQALLSVEAALSQTNLFSYLK